MSAEATTPAAALPAAPGAQAAALRTERSLLWVLPLAIVSAVCIAYLALDLHPVDLAASTYRANLFADHGLTLWNGNWYGGHYTLSYSVLSPPLTWLFGSVSLEVACALASTALFQIVTRRHFGPGAVWGATWFAVSAGTLVFHGRVPFGIGVAVGLGAVLAMQRDRHRIAALLAIVCGLASPVAGLFLALAGVSVALAEGRRYGYGVAACAIVPVLLLQL